MQDFYEIDFLNVESKKSGDAIPLRYQVNGNTYVHVVDGGFQATGEKVCEHIRKYYKANVINNVVATHPDGDHAGGLRTVLEQFEVEALWMLRPWIYSKTLLQFFPTYNSEQALISRLRSIYPNIAALEDIALQRGIPIREPLQGAKIGAFTVCAPQLIRYLELVIDSEKTPESDATTGAANRGLLHRMAEAKKTIMRSLWGQENFSDEDTSAENEMSVVQFAEICGRKILLTGDTGRDGLNEAADYVESNGIALPGLQIFDVPHHGSRRNVSTETLNRWLGPKLLRGQKSNCIAVISASKEDPDHPRKSVIRGCMHRGSDVITTEECDLTLRCDSPNREGWGPLEPVSYPEDQEE